MASAHDVAAALREAVGGSVGALKIQKLLYYAQGWSLAWKNAPLFEEDLEAWPLGPVVPEVWRAYNEQSGSRVGNPDNLTPDERAIVDAVAQGYGHLTGQALKQMTHAESPWQDARGDLPPNMGTNRSLSRGSMQKFFKTLPFGPEGQSRPVDEHLIDRALNREPGALADLIEQGTGARPLPA